MYLVLTSVSSQSSDTQATQVFVLFRALINSHVCHLFSALAITSSRLFLSLFVSVFAYGKTLGLANYRLAMERKKQQVVCVCVCVCVCACVRACVRMCVCKCTVFIGRPKQLRSIILHVAHLSNEIISNQKLTTDNVTTWFLLTNH